MVAEVINEMVTEIIISEWKAVRLQEYANIDLKEPFSEWWVYIKAPLMLTETGGYTHQ